MQNPKGSETSHICGEGHGSDHLWKRIKTAQVGGAPCLQKWTLYECARCDEPFVHRYDLVPNVFEAMAVQGVPPLCRFKEA